MHTRREVCLAAGAALTTVRNAQAQDRRDLLYIGTYTGRGSRGIYAVEMDPETGALGEPKSAAETPNPSFLVFSRSGRHLYACNEIGDYNGEKTGSITAFRWEPGSGALKKINTQASKGASPCFVSLDTEGTHLLTANYSGGSVAVLPIRADGGLLEASSMVKHAGSSINKQRQEAPHAHSIQVSLDGKFALVPDLGLDKVHIYKYYAKEGMLAPHQEHSLPAAPGAGPRHMAWHPSGRFVYVINELDSTIAVYSWDRDAGTGGKVQSVSTLPRGYADSSTCAEVVVHPSGRFVYGSNRGHDSIAVFSVEDATGMLSPLQHMPTGGRTPRGFVLHPSGRWLLAANQGSDNIHVFQLDIASGRLSATRHSAAVSMPVCLKFHPGAA
jgi:6-phosphogluconolactonase